MAEESLPSELQEILDSDDLVEYCERENILSDVKSKVCSGYHLDLESMDDWLQKLPHVIKIASMEWDEGDKTFPFVGASKVMMPYLAQACIDFWSRTVPDVINKKSIAHCAVTGRNSQEKEDRAARVESAINYQLSTGIQGWKEKTSHALNYLPAVGMYFKKKWYEGGEIKDNFIPADCLIYDHCADSFAEAPRKSYKFKLTRNKYRTKVVMNGWHEINLPDNVDTEVDEDLCFIESQCTLDLDGDGYQEPYLVTWYEDDETIVDIQRLYDEFDVVMMNGEVAEIKGEELYTQTGFLNDLKSCAIYVGWGFLLYDIFEALNTMYRQLLDAGTLANLASNTGFIASNSALARKARGGKYEMIMGQLTKVDAGGTGKLSDSIYTMPFNGPHPGAYDMLQNLKDEVMKYTAASQMVDIPTGEAASLGLARLQQALKVPNAITSQVYFGLTEEFK